MSLWGYCAEHRVDGKLTGLSDEDIEIAGGWEGEIGVLVVALVEVGYLDGDERNRQVHDWSEHQPFVVSKPQRVSSARRANAIRWHDRGQHEDAPMKGCPLCYPQSYPQCDPESGSESGSESASSASNAGVAGSSSHSGESGDTASLE